MWPLRTIIFQHTCGFANVGRKDPQRFFVDLLLGVTIIALAAIFMDVRARDDARNEAIAATRASLAALAGEIRLRAVLAAGPGGDILYPQTIESDWFGDEQPVNALLGAGCPWLEIAAPCDRDLRHPRQPVASDRGRAAFWYNPSNGCIRARVPASLSDEETVTIYNRVNLTRLNELRTVAAVEDRDY